jgi:hypothetical protein
MYMAVALLVWVAWIINPKYEVRRRRYENTFNAYLPIMSRSGLTGAGFFIGQILLYQCICLYLARKR